MANYPEILADDEAIVVINKPAGLAMHAPAGKSDETVVDWLIKNYPAASGQNWPDAARPGIVHRLDKDTTGVVVLAKTANALVDLQSQFKDRTVRKIYFALVYGRPTVDSGRVETHIGRHPKRRTKQVILPLDGSSSRRLAITEYAVLATQEITVSGQKATLSLIRFEPKSGRMHQLRLHAKYLGWPIIGDKIYTIKPAKRLSMALRAGRQMLHAQSITFHHPTRYRRMTFSAPLAADFAQLVRQYLPNAFS